MASLTPPVSIRHGVRCVTANGVNVEEVLLAVGQEIGYENISSASRMNKAVVVFLKEENHVNHLISSGIVGSGDFVTVLPLVAPTIKVTVSNVPPFIQSNEIERELLRYGKLASAIKTVPLGCRNEALKHVMSFRRQVFMFLNEQALDVSFKVWHEGRAYMVYANTGNMKCFECGDVGHKRLACPHKAQADEAVGPVKDPENVQSVEEEEDEPQGAEEAIVVVEEDEPQGAEEAVELNEENDNQTEESGIVNNETTGMVGNKVMSEDRETVASSGGNGVGSENIGDAEMRDEDALSEFSEIGSQVIEDMYPLEEINDFLDTTFGKIVEVEDFFPDVDKFIISVLFLQKTVSYEVLDKKKRFRLKKMVTKLRRRKAKV